MGSTLLVVLNSEMFPYRSLALKEDGVQITSEFYYFTLSVIITKIKKAFFALKEMTNNCLDRTLKFSLIEVKFIRT